MSALMALVIAILVSITLSTILVRVLSQPLHQVLAQLCPTGEASRFWVAFTAVMLYVAPLLFVVYFPSLNDGADVATVVRATLAAALFGAFAALLVVGYKIAGAKRPVTGG
jgi:hypothetical protein